jgi:hypothetical protein
MAARHGVGVLFTPLIGSGTEGMEPRVSLQAIATAVRETAAARPELALTVVVIAFDEAAIARAVAREILEQALGPGWTLKT